MAAIAFDTLKFARALREKAKLSPEQAEGFADVLADIQVVRGDIEALKIQTRADIAALRLTTQADIASANVETLRWLVGAIGFQTLAVLGAVITLTRTFH
ncbi:hypothetical protein [Methylobacterium brachiatum]|uniref:hypothetical protein n=1 Tax=Methylobacterium brachiatum TaxID=269660 RepID=UPI000EFCBD8B|nr:hypothetical protein [Methylobacterium brachiatum]AYO84342.1 hypothetical protein EBB05_20120 [Methylobacterium brachiatum]